MPGMRSCFTSSCCGCFCVTIALSFGGGVSSIPQSRRWLSWRQDGLFVPRSPAITQVARQRCSQCCRPSLFFQCWRASVDRLPRASSQKSLTKRVNQRHPDFECACARRVDIPFRSREPFTQRKRQPAACHARDRVRTSNEHRVVREQEQARLRGLPASLRNVCDA